MSRTSSPSTRRRVRSALPPTGRLLLVLLALSAALAALAFVPRGVTGARPPADPRAKRDAAVFVPGSVLVRFRSDASAKAAGGVRALRADGRELAVRVERFEGSELVEGLRVARVAAEDTLAAVEAFNARPDVLYAEPSYVRRREGAPNDPQFVNQWAVRNGNTFSTDPDIEAEAAWDITTGSRSVVVGVVDEGIDINHPDLQANVWTNPGDAAGDGVDNDNNGFVDDANGWDFYHHDASVFDGAGQSGANATDAHGTHVAGIVGAVGNNNVGVAGVNWQVSLMSLKILPRECPPSNFECDPPAPSSVEVTIRAFQYAKAMRELYQSSGGARGANLRVLNNSYGGLGRSQAEEDAIRALGDAGILFVASAGNSQEDNDRLPHYPSNYNLPNLVAVAASERTGGIRWQGSNFGRTSVHLAAPGDQVLSTTPGDTYDYFSGTSMAAPHVTGVAALLCAKSPNVSLARLRAALLASGKSTHFWATATERRLHARAALDALDEQDTTPPGAPSSFRVSAASGRNVNLSWVAPGDDGVSGQAAFYEARFSDTEITTPAQFERARRLYVPAVPKPAFGSEDVLSPVPFRHASGFVALRAVDSAGNAGPIVSARATLNELEVDPYVVNAGSAAPLSTGGTALNLRADDEYKRNHPLPFTFPFYGLVFNSVNVSTNGVLYLSFGDHPPIFPDGSPADFIVAAELLNGRTAIAGAWDDLRTDRRAGDDVYVVQPDADRVIFRWQAVTVDFPLGGGQTRGENPVNFEIELRRDGTVVTRYGDGNQKMVPVVGLGGGAPDAYLVASHTNDSGLKDLTNAPAITFARRTANTTPRADVRLQMTGDRNPVPSGGRLTYTLTVSNQGATDAANVSVTSVLPATLRYVSCSVPPSSGMTCGGPAVGSTGTVTFNLGTISPAFPRTFSFTVDVSAPAGASVTGAANATTSTPETDATNNNASVSTDVTGGGSFGGVVDIAARERFTLALKSDGTVWGWGEADKGQVYDGSLDNFKILPVQVSGVSGATAVAAGNGFGLALRNDGTVWAWGDNSLGQLGSAEVPLGKRNQAVRVRGLSNVTAVAAGSAHGLALRSDGTVWSWGWNGVGELGLGDRDETAHVAPVRVRGLSNVLAVAAGNGTSMALKSDGTVWVWGGNFNGLVGQGPTVFFVGTPTQMPGLSNVIRIFAGYQN
ncbi:MAG TPA: S8 family serine peptidase, partial [Pyrinomonadaceae bacterium]|nr:S8 family serine peptidase [Pyrinomonadaceae bacterium]